MDSRLDTDSKSREQSRVESRLSTSQQQQQQISTHRHSYDPLVRLPNMTNTTRKTTGAHWHWHLSILLWMIWQKTTCVSSSAVSAPETDRRQQALAREQPLAAFRGGSGDRTTATSSRSKLFRRFADDSRMPSLFTRREEEIFDKYAACLAATEGLRRIRDAELLAAKEALKEGSSSAELTKTKTMLEAEKHITAKYVQNSSKILKALGMPVGQFNDLGRVISKDPALKRKVMEQAYLYRMAATMNMDRIPLIEDPGSAELLREAVPRDKIKLFSESLAEIEDLRENQIRRLTQALHVDKFPEHINISDPGLLPFLNPKVRAVVEAFPLQAEDIVKKHGLQSEEFNKMLAETKSNPIFRWKVRRHISSVERKNIVAPATPTPAAKALATPDSSDAEKNGPPPEQPGTATAPLPDTPSSSSSITATPVPAETTDSGGPIDRSSAEA